MRNFSHRCTAAGPHSVQELRRDYDDILMKKLAKSRRVQSDTSLPWNMAKKPELAPEETVRAQAEIAEVFKRFLKVRHLNWRPWAAVEKSCERTGRGSVG
jgi:hypothetical protein